VDAQGDEPDWFRVVAWERQAETVCEYLSKGSQVCVEGRLSPNTYEKKDGTQVETVEVVAFRVHFLGSKSDAGGGQAAAPAAEEAEDLFGDDDEDDPFGDQ